MTRFSKHWNAVDTDIPLRHTVRTHSALTEGSYRSSILSEYLRFLWMRPAAALLLLGLNNKDLDVIINNSDSSPY